MKVRRYEWSDAIVEAQAVGVITNRELTTAMKLAHAITWVPENGKPSGLYWANELAAETVGLPRATLYRGIKGLKEAGYLEETAGNLIPVIPDSHAEVVLAFQHRANALKQSHFDTKKSQLDTAKSQSETPKSQLDNPYSVDTFTVDTSTVDVSTVDKDSADAPSFADKEIEGHEEDGSSSLPNNNGIGLGNNSEEDAQSQSETESVNRKVDNW